VPRKAKFCEEDLQHILRLSKKFHEISPWSFLQYDASTMFQYVKNLILNENSVIFIHDKGMIAGTLAPIIFSTKYIGQEIAWYSEGSGKVLLKTFENWAKRKGAVSVLLSSLFYGNDVDHSFSEWYKKLGYSPQEAHYIKEL